MDETAKTEEIVTEAKLEEIVPTVEPTAIVTKEKEYYDRLLRLQAEFENFRRRTEREKSENSANSNAQLILQLLEVLDNFELSLKHNPDKGVQLIYTELKTILNKQGLKIIDTNQPFNPKFHEVVISVDGEKDGIILEELKKGYLLNDKLLRASKVKVSRKTEKK